MRYSLFCAISLLKWRRDQIFEELLLRNEFFVTFWYTPFRCSCPLETLEWNEPLQILDSKCDKDVAIRKLFQKKCNFNNDLLPISFKATWRSSVDNSNCAICQKSTPWLFVLSLFWRFRVTIAEKIPVPRLLSITYVGTSIVSSVAKGVAPKGIDSLPPWTHIYILDYEPDFPECRIFRILDTNFLHSGRRTSQKSHTHTTQPNFHFSHSVKVYIVWNMLLILRGIYTALGFQQPIPTSLALCLTCTLSSQPFLHHFFLFYYLLFCRHTASTPSTSGSHIFFWILGCYAATQLAIQLQPECIQLVYSNREARKHPAESNGTPAMDHGMNAKRIHM